MIMGMSSIKTTIKIMYVSADLKIVLVLLYHQMIGQNMVNT